jgi:outer membrane biosynthesis protein TonB
LALRIQLTPEASKKVVFDHPKPDGLPTGVLGQTKICTCVDNNGNLTNPVKLVRASGSPQLDAEATEISQSISYPAGHPGCMHQTVNFTAP